MSRNSKFKSSLPDTKLSVTYSQNIEVTDTSRSVSGIPNFELRVFWHEIIAYLQSVHAVHQWNWDTHLIRMRIRGFCTTRIRTPNSCYKFKEMLVSCGGGEVAVFHITFCLPSKIYNFSLATCSNWSFSRHLQDIDHK